MMMVSAVTHGKMLSKPDMQITSPTVVVGFERKTYSISEGNGSVEVCVQVSGVLQSSLHLSLTTVDGTATGKQGYSLICSKLQLSVDFAPTTTVCK